MPSFFFFQPREPTMSKISKIREKLSLLTKKSVAREIDGQTFNFYPISVGMLFQLRTAMGPLLGIVRGFFQGQGGDGARTVEKLKTKDGEKEVTTLAAPTLEVLKFRDEQQRREGSELVANLLSEENKALFGRVLADSLRDDLGPNITDDEAREFISGLDLAALGQFLGGFMAANVKVFGPLAGAAEKLLRQKLQGVVAPAAETPNQSPDQTQS